jgi:hypothetical protein
MTFGAFPEEAAIDEKDFRVIGINFMFEVEVEMNGKMYMF